MDEDIKQMRLTEVLEIRSDEYLDSIGMRDCSLQAYLNFHGIDAKESSQEERQNPFKLPKVVLDWAEQFSDEYNDENAYFLEGIGTD